MSRFWDIKAAGEVAEVYITGDIVFDEQRQYDSDVSADSFRAELEAAGDVSQIDLYVQSLGGNFWQALAMSAVLAKHPARVTAYVQGYAASAATLILAMADEVTAPKNALLLYHAPLAIAVGYFNAGDLRDMAENLDKLLPSMLATYKRKKRDLTMDDMVNDLFTDSWFTASEARDLGLVDVVSDDEVEIAAYASPWLDVYAEVPDALKAAPAGGRSEEEDARRAELIATAEASKARTQALRDSMSFAARKKGD